MQKEIESIATTLEAQDVLLVLSCRISALEETFLRLHPDKMNELETFFLRLIYDHGKEFPKLKELADTIAKERAQNENKN